MTMANRLNYRRFSGLLLILVTLFVAACSDQEHDPEDQVHQFIKSAKLAAESRNTDDLGDLISEKYIDDKKLTRASLIKMARGYFFRHKNIHLFTRTGMLELSKNPDGSARADVVIYVAMSGQVVKDINALSGIRANFYRFQLVLNEEGTNWKLLTARWNRVQFNEFFGSEN